MTDSRNAWLDACRALAILLVVLSHGRFFLLGNYAWAEKFRFGGFLGVELFFVLSGFLIGGILITVSRRPGPWLGSFYIRRWLRTLPNYYVFLGFNLLLLAVAIRPGDPADAWRHALFLQNLISAPPQFFPEAWSLAVEEVFYLLFPALILLLARSGRCSPDQALLLAAASVIVASLAARMLAAPSILSWDDDLRKVVFYRLDALMFGVLLAWLHDRRHPIIRHRGVAAVAVLLFIACAVYFARSSDADLNASYFAKTIYFDLVSLGCAGIILAGLKWALPAPVAAMTGFLARVSYSAYLTNIPVALILLALTDCCASQILAFAYWLAFILITFASAHLQYQWLERPFYRLRDRYFPA